MKFKNVSHAHFFANLKVGDLIISNRFKKGFALIIKITPDYFIFYPSDKAFPFPTNKFSNSGDLELRCEYLVLR